MKRSILVVTAVAALFLVSCKESPYIAGPGTDDPRIPDSVSYVVPDTNGIEISVDSAIALCKTLAADAVTPDLYKISGVVTKNTTNPLSVPSSYSNINFTLSDNGNKTSIACYYTNNLNNLPFRKNSDVPRVGSKITVLGPLTNYKGTTPEVKEGFIVRVDSMVAPPPFPGCPEPDSTEISVSKACELALKLADKTESTESYDIVGVVTEILSIDTGNFGNAEWIISDGKKFFYIYRGKGLNNNKFTNTNQLQVNDTITVRSKLYNYGGIAETKANAAQIIKTTNPNW
ncbi:MAG: hypothetical protein IJS82_00825 [Paludibacteraceae bacterium]|nr:hypothetical protein [Paludibacteraceae bacterium]